MEPVLGVESIEAKNYLGLFDDRGDVDFQKACDFLEFSKKQMAESFGVNENSIRPERMSKSTKQRVTALAEAMEMVAILFKGDVDKTRKWFKVPNPNLGGNSPRNLILIKRSSVLFDFINSARRGY